jgi:hypothetical protein
MVNIGEIDEPEIIAKIISLKGSNVNGIGIINKVADYRNIEYPPFISFDKIEKAPTQAKRDVIINGKSYSLKSSRAAPSALVNHTTREKWLRIADKIGVSIDPLDQMINNYWKLRLEHKIGEDVSTNTPFCPFGTNENEINYLKKFLHYFLFDGSGATDSKFPADYILVFDDPNNVFTWKIYDRTNAADLFWGHLVFSVRANKGMPPSYPNVSPDLKRLIDPWVRFCDGDYRGSLHIRLRH